MNFDLEQTLDFVEKRNFKRSMEYYENRKKKRKLHFEQASNNNELSDIIPSFPLHIDLKPKVTTNVENNCLYSTRGLLFSFPSFKSFITDFFRPIREKN